MPPHGNGGNSTPTIICEEMFNFMSHTWNQLKTNALTVLLKYNVQRWIRIHVVGSDIKVLNVFRDGVIQTHHIENVCDSFDVGFCNAFNA